MALNAPIQGSRRRHHQSVAMLGVHRGLARASMRSRLLLTGARRCSSSRSPRGRDQLEALVRREMGSASTSTSTLDVSVGIGLNWDAAAH